MIRGTSPGVPSFDKEGPRRRRGGRLPAGTTSKGELLLIDKLPMPT